jgi:hypothetical protein
MFDGFMQYTSPNAVEPHSFESTVVDQAVTVIFLRNRALRVVEWQLTHLDRCACSYLPASARALCLRVLVQDWQRLVRAVNAHAPGFQYSAVSCSPHPRKILMHAGLLWHLDWNRPQGLVWVRCR